MKPYLLHPIALLLVLLLSGSNCSTPTWEARAEFAATESQPPSHRLWSQLLQEHVHGPRVDYEGFRQDRQQLEQYLDLLEANLPTESWTEAEKLAYWINAYNAYTVQLILEHYPVESIKDIGSAVQVPLVNSPWDIEFIRIGGEDYDLNDLEHGILRSQFQEPRIHFAVNCASISCPPLRNEAYVASRLDEQLDEQARLFINNPKYNRISREQVELSKLFEWYRGDFTEDGSLIDYLNRYSDTRISLDAEVVFLPYDWGLND